MLESIIVQEQIVPFKVSPTFFVPLTILVSLLVLLQYQLILIHLILTPQVVQQFIQL